MSDDPKEPKSTITQVMKVVGATIPELKTLTQEDRVTLRRWLDDELAATKAAG